MGLFKDPAQLPAVFPKIKDRSALISDYVDVNSDQRIPNTAT